MEQDDSLLGVLTVQETVSYTLALHQPHLSKVDNQAQVDRVIKSLGLEGCKDQIIGTPIKRGISGGQRRRVSIACGAICSPYVGKRNDDMPFRDYAKTRQSFELTVRFSYWMNLLRA